MKSATRTKYGNQNVLTIKETAKPIPKENEILVRVYASTVNRTDCAILLGKPFVMRFVAGLFTPKPIGGTDFAGKIEAIGKNVKSFQTGDRVFGFIDTGLTSHAEYMVLDANKPMLTIPEEITYEQAAASAEGFHYAYNFITKVKLKPGQKILVNGATGAIGSAAVQLLKSFDVYITTTCATEHIELIKSLGADKVIDYTKTDFTKDNETYDFVFDAVGKSSFGKCQSLLNKKGIYISSELGAGGQNLFLALFSPLIRGKKVIFPFPVKVKRSLEAVKKLMEEKKFRPVIDREYPLEKIADAYEYVLTGKKIGNVVIKI